MSWRVGVLRRALAHRLFTQANARTGPVSSGCDRLTYSFAMHNNPAMKSLPTPAAVLIPISSAPRERPGKRAGSRARSPARSHEERAFACPASASPAARGAHSRRYHGRHWAADPSGRFPSDRSPTRRHARPARRSTRLASTTPAASGFVAHASGARSHEVVSMALSAVARVAHRGAASTDNSGDGAGLLTQIPAPAVLPRRLPPRPAPAARPPVRRRRASSCRGSRRRWARPWR